MPIKRLIIKKGKNNNSVLVRGELYYNSNTCNLKPINKKGKSLSETVPVTLPVGVAISASKLKDINNLLKTHFGAAWKDLPSLSFYKGLPTSTANDDVEEEQYCENHYDEESEIICRV